MSGIQPIGTADDTDAQRIEGLGGGGGDAALVEELGHLSVRVTIQKVIDLSRHLLGQLTELSG